jgi:hypothetical protein
MFTQGNPFFALESMVRYYRARDERKAVAMTERLGQANSPLTVDELLEALADPRFNVRFEAIISIARTKPHPRLTEALSNIVSGTELSLSVVAAWALGRLGDPEAIPVLREGLNSEYRSIQSHCARALGTLRDHDSAPVLLQRVAHESDKGLQMAFASALGNLQAEEAVDTLFTLLRDTENEGARMELALALARMVGDEHHFIRLLRQVRQDAGTAASQELNAVRGKLNKHLPASSPTMETLLPCSESFAREDLSAAMAQLGMILSSFPSGIYTPVAQSILTECAYGLQTYGVERLEYLMLALHILHSGWAK